MELVTLTPAIRAERGIRVGARRAGLQRQRARRERDRAFSAATSSCRSTASPIAQRRGRAARDRLRMPADGAIRMLFERGGSIYYHGFRDSDDADRTITLLRPRSPSATRRRRCSSSGRRDAARALAAALARARRSASRSSASPIPDEAIAQMRAHLDDIDFDAVAAYERRFRHDVMAHVHAFGDVAPAAQAVHPPRRDERVRHRQRRPDPHAARARPAARASVIDVLRALAAFAREWRAEPTLGYTHLQPAQLTTVGKRATLWMQDLVLDLADLDHRVATLPFRGVKGTTGTQASFLELFDGDHEKVRELDRRVTAAMGFAHVAPGDRADVHAQARRAGARRRGRHRRERREVQRRHPHAAGVRRDRGAVRVASRSARRRWRTSATRCGRERIASLARFVASLEPNANQTHAVQYFERTLDDSANRRLVIPEVVPRHRRDPRADGERRARARGAPGAHSPARRRTSCPSWRPRS